MDATSPLLSSSAMDHQKIQNHFLIVPFPAHGHINPALEFSRRVIRCGVQITFVTTLFAHRNMINHSNSYPQELTFEPFSDGFDDLDAGKDLDADQYLLQFRRYGSEALQRLVKTFANASCPITCLIYTQGLNFPAEVAHKFELSSALLWIQPATVFDVFFYFFGGYKEVILHNINDPLYTVKLPGLPLLKAQDLPSYLLPSDPNPVGLKYFRGQFESLEQEAKSFTVLVNSFDQLEGEALKVVDRFNMIGIGPLIPSSIFSGKDSADGDLTDPSRRYIEWLDARDKSSVVYVSFGTFAVLSKKQMEELARGLVDSGKPFLWVIRSGKHGSMQQENDKDADETYRKILEEEHKGIVVPWSSQVEVLIHPSIGCFVTHCGWNSTLETLAAGVPVVGFPQFADQPTNAKLIEDVWKMGVRVRPNEEDKIVKSEEIVRCLEKVMEGESGDELRGNAKKWKELAKEAAREDGSSERNLRTFLHTFE